MPQGYSQFPEMSVNHYAQGQLYVCNMGFGEQTWGGDYCWPWGDSLSGWAWGALQLGMITEEAQTTREVKHHVKWYINGSIVIANSFLTYWLLFPTALGRTLARASSSTPAIASSAPLQLMQPTSPDDWWACTFQSLPQRFPAWVSCSPRLLLWSFMPDGLLCYANLCSWLQWEGGMYMEVEAETIAEPHGPCD